MPPAPRATSNLLHESFQAGILVKGVFALVEALGGVLLWLFGDRAVTLVQRLTFHELTEHPGDRVASGLSARDRARPPTRVLIEVNVEVLLLTVFVSLALAALGVVVMSGMDALIKAASADAHVLAITLGRYAFAAIFAAIICVGAPSLITIVQGWAANAA